MHARYTEAHAESSKSPALNLKVMCVYTQSRLFPSAETIECPALHTVVKQRNNRVCKRFHPPRTVTHTLTKLKKREKWT